MHTCLADCWLCQYIVFRFLYYRGFRVLHHHDNWRGSRCALPSTGNCHLCVYIWHLPPASVCGESQANGSFFPKVHYIELCRQTGLELKVLCTISGTCAIFCGNSLCCFHVPILLVFIITSVEHKRRPQNRSLITPTNPSYVSCCAYKFG